MYIIKITSVDNALKIYYKNAEIRDIWDMTRDKKAKKGLVLRLRHFHIL